MSRFGLNVIELSEAEKKVWKDYFDLDIIIKKRGGDDKALRELFDFRLYNQVQAELIRYRRQNR